MDTKVENKTTQAYLRSIERMTNVCREYLDQPLNKQDLKKSVYIREALKNLALSKEFFLDGSSSGVSLAQIHTEIARLLLNKIGLD